MRKGVNAIVIFFDMTQFGIKAKYSFTVASARNLNKNPLEKLKLLLTGVQN